MSDIKVVDNRIYRRIESSYRIVGIVARRNEGLGIRLGGIDRRIIRSLINKSFNSRVDVRRKLVDLRLMRIVEVIDYRVDRRVEIGDRISRVIARCYEGLGVCLCGADSRVIRHIQGEGRRSLIDVRRVLVDLCLMSNVKIKYYGVDRVVNSRYRFACMASRVDERLSVRYRRVDRRVIGRLQDKSRYRIIDVRSVLIDLRLVCDIKAVDDRVDFGVKVCNARIRIISGINESRAVRDRRIDRRIIGILENECGDCGIDLLRVLVDLCLICDVEIIYYRVELCSECRNRRVCIVAGRNESLCARDRRIDCRVIGRLLNECGNSGVDIRRILINLCLMCYIEVVDYSVYSCRQSGNRIICIQTRRDEGLSVGNRRVYR